MLCPFFWESFFCQFNLQVPITGSKRVEETFSLLITIFYFYLFWGYWCLLQGCSTMAPMVVWAGFCYEIYTTRGRKFSRISGLCPTDGNSADVTTKQKYLQTLPNVLLGAKALAVKYYLSLHSIYWYLPGGNTMTVHCSISLPNCWAHGPSLKLARVGIFTSQELTNTTN